jgi:hypothetical protein
MYFDLDSHDAYATTDGDDLSQLVPNPAKKKHTTGPDGAGPLRTGTGWPPPWPCWTR